MILALVMNPCVARLDSWPGLEQYLSVGLQADSARITASPGRQLTCDAVASATNVTTSARCTVACFLAFHTQFGLARVAASLDSSLCPAGLHDAKMKDDVSGHTQDDPP